MLLAALASRAVAADVTVAVTDSSGTYRIHGEFRANISPKIAWQVLSDYDSIGRFVSSIRESRLEHRPDGGLQLRQAASAGFFPIHRTVHVLLDLQEEPGRSIRFTDRLGQDFSHYDGRWLLSPEPDGVHVRYEVEARPRGGSPAMLARAVMRGSARDLLDQVRAEMVRRGRLTDR